MDISSLSIALSQSKLQTDWGVKMLSNSLDFSKAEGQEMVNMMEQQRVLEMSVNPYLGTNFDISI